MADFDQTVELSLEIPTRELSSARSQIEDGLADIPLSFDEGSAARNTGGGGGGGAGGVSNRKMQRWARQRTEDISDILKILQNVDENLGDSGDGGGRGPLPRLPDLGGLAMLGGGLAIGASVWAASELITIGQRVTEDVEDLITIGDPMEVGADALIGIGTLLTVPVADLINIGDKLVVDVPDLIDIGEKLVVDVSELIEVEEPTPTEEPTETPTPLPPPMPTGPRNPFNDTGFYDESPSPTPTPGPLDKFETLTNLPVAMTAAGLENFTPLGQEGAKQTAIGSTLAGVGVGLLGPGGATGAGSALASIIGNVAASGGGDGGGTVDTSPRTGTVGPGLPEVRVDNSTDIQVEAARDEDAIVSETMDSVESDLIQPLRRELERALGTNL